MQKRLGYIVFLLIFFGFGVTRSQDLNIVSNEILLIIQPDVNVDEGEYINLLAALINAFETNLDNFTLIPLFDEPGNIRRANFYSVSDYETSIINELVANDALFRLFPLGQLPGVDSSEACSGILAKVTFSIDMTNLDELRDKLQKLQVEINRILGPIDEVTQVTIDPETTTCTGHESLSQSEEQILTGISLDQIDHAQGGENVVIGVLDTGVTTIDSPDPNAVNFSPNMLPISFNGRTWRGLDLTSSHDDAYDNFILDGDNVGHGTPIAFLSHLVAPQAEILPIRICEKIDETANDASCLGSNIIIGTCFAINTVKRHNEAAPNQAKQLVLNYSFSSNFDPFAINISGVNRTFSNFFHDVTSSDNVLIANSIGSHPDEDPQSRLETNFNRFPAGFDIGGMVSVTALEGDGVSPRELNIRSSNTELATLGSNLLHDSGGIQGGKRYLVHDSATARDILIPTNQDDMVEGYSGTSFANAITTGTLALMRSIAPNVPSLVLENCLTNYHSSIQRTPLGIGTYEVNILDVERAMMCAERERGNW